MSAPFSRIQSFLAAITLLCGAFTLSPSTLAAERSSPPATKTSHQLRFNRDVLPILSDKCFACHGPDASHREADLRLDVRENAIDYGAIVPDRPEESPLVERVTSDDPDLVMPPPSSHKELTASQKEILRRWIAEGAEYEGHWAYQAPSKVAVPADSAPIDYFIEQRLQDRGLAPVQEADRRTLARRLYFDLLGIPPTPAQVEAFVADSSPDAYARLVEKLLASPHHGERLAVTWLDVVRFADTIGYHSDNPRNVWPFRDYVIRSFNENKPFDQFTIEQLAGDLVENPTQEQLVASAFNHLLLTTEEGGAQAKDYEARMLGDRVRAVGTAWLGQTLGCAQCHDHKYDPTLAKDFYSMGAFFADIKEPIIGKRDPGMLVTTEAQDQQLASLKSQAANLQRQFEASSPEIEAAQAEWEQQLAKSISGTTWTPLHPTNVTSEGGVQFKIEKDGDIQTRRNPQRGTDIYRVTVKPSLNNITGFRLDVLPPSPSAKGPGKAANGNFVLSEFRVTDESGATIPLAHASATFEQPDFPAERTIDGIVEPQNGWAVMGSTTKENHIAFELANPLTLEGDEAVIFTLEQPYGTNHVIGRFRLSATTQPKPIRAGGSGIPQEVADILAIEKPKRSAAQSAQLTTHFKSVIPLLADLRTKLDAAKKAATDFENSLPRCLTAVSMEQPRIVRIHPRGNWMDESGPAVEPALPHYLPQSKLPPGRRLNRLDLANWIVSKDNPLTARVFVNRLWKQFYGVGLSKTLDDLGTQGEYPSHPELLDWLACEFMDSGWDTRHMIRLMVTSRAYRRSSVPPVTVAVSTELSPQSPDPQSLDPDNRLLARQNRWRLDAEFVRDNALAVSGLLVPTLGGPSAKPYQPEGYWENLNFPTRNYEASTGPDQYRRGLYTWWQRSFMHPSFLAFDAPTREECAAERSRSNIPQQALVLLNDPTYVEAARLFATRILREAGDTPATRLEWAWQTALQRPPRLEELQAATTLLEKEQDRFSTNPEAAKSFLSVGQSPLPSDLDPVELATWTTIARLLLNLHETITRS